MLWCMYDDMYEDVYEDEHNGRCLEDIGLVLKPTCILILKPTLTLRLFMHIHIRH